MARYIDADNLLARYKARCVGCRETKSYCEYRCDIADIISDIEDATTADVEPVKHGVSATCGERMARWERSNTPHNGWKCSSCGCSAWNYNYNGTGNRSNYCPSCGAKMEE